VKFTLIRHPTNYAEIRYRSQSTPIFTPPTPRRRRLRPWWG